MKCKPIPGFAGYYATEAGEILSAWSAGRSAYITAMLHVLSYSQRNGYANVKIKNDQGVYVGRTVHRLIALTFLGERPYGYDVCHNDGNPLNNALSNLRYDTRKGNKADEVKHGTRNRGERNGCAKLSESDVQEIKRLIDQGWNDTQIAHKFEVTNSTISYIHRGDTWHNATTQQKE